MLIVAGVQVNMNGIVKIGEGDEGQVGAPLF